MTRFGFIVAILLSVMLVDRTSAETQSRRTQKVVATAPNVLVLRVQPRSFLDPGTVVPVGSLNRTASGFAQTQSYLSSPPYSYQGDRFGQGALPDPITNGPFVGSRSPFGPVDYVAPSGLAR